MISTIGWIIIWVGVLFDLLGAIGLIRFPDVYNRLQASTKCVTLGTLGIMIGAGQNTVGQPFPGRFFHGLLDEIRIYDRPLPDPAIDALCDVSAVCGG